MRKLRMGNDSRIYDAWIKWLDHNIDDSKAEKIKTIVNKSPESFPAIKRCILALHRLDNHKIVTPSEIRDSLEQLRGIRVKKIDNNLYKAIQAYLGEKIKKDQRQFTLPDSSITALLELSDSAYPSIKEDALFLLATVDDPKQRGIPIEVLLECLTVSPYTGAQAVKKLFSSYGMTAESKIRRYMEDNEITSDCINKIFEDLADLYSNKIPDKRLSSESLEELSRIESRSLRLALLLRYRYDRNLWKSEELERLNMIFEIRQLDFEFESQSSPFVDRIKRIKLAR
jgi:hypothetical protein